MDANDNNDAPQALGHSVTQHNDLIEASYELTLSEQRLLLACIAQIDSRKPMPRRRLTVYARHYAELFNMPRNKAFQRLNEAADRLYNRSLRFRGTDSGEDYRWVDHRKYHRGEGYVTVTFTEYVAPYLTKLHERFTSYKLQCIAGLESTYAIRLYQLLVQHRSFGTRTIEIAELREMLCLEGKYQRFANFKARVIQPAVDAINASTDLAVGWRSHRERREVQAITFTFVAQPRPQLELRV